MIELPDVNVLVALRDKQHIHFKAANDWFAAASQKGWALCPITVSGFIRVVSRANYVPAATMTEAAGFLKDLIKRSSAAYHFWADDVSLLDETQFDLTKLQGYRQMTDLHLLGIANRNGGALVTLDGGLISTINAVRSARPRLLRLLAP